MWGAASPFLQREFRRAGRARSGFPVLWGQGFRTHGQTLGFNAKLNTARGMHEERWSQTQRGAPQLGQCPGVCYGILLSLILSLRNVFPWSEQGYLGLHSPSEVLTWSPSCPPSLPLQGFLNRLYWQHPLLFLSPLDPKEPQSP